MWLLARCLGQGQAPTRAGGNAARSAGEGPWRGPQEGLHRPGSWGSPRVRAGDDRRGPGRGGVTLSGEHRASRTDIQGEAAGAQGPGRVAGVTKSPRHCPLPLDARCVRPGSPGWPHPPNLGTVSYLGPESHQEQGCLRRESQTLETTKSQTQVVFGTLVV